MTGIVFDIQRFSLHDGPGIRTTVFLKGCPLQCVWCHNPESQAHEPQLSYNEERCTSCPACIIAKRKGVIALQSGPLAIDLSSDAACQMACPHGAFTVIGRAMSAESVMEEVMRDSAYYLRSGGGMTISGGEPLAQFEFTMELLRLAKANNLHTCVDTSGAAPRKKVMAAARYTDLFLYDYKATDPAAHRAVTGASSFAILRNLDLLYESGARIHIRCPLIPGVNDSADHLAGIAELEKAYPNVDAIEVMPYHDLGRDKARRVGMVYPLADLPSADEACQQRWLDELRSLGCRRVYIA